MASPVHPNLSKCYPIHVFSWTRYDRKSDYNVRPLTITCRRDDMSESAFSKLKSTKGFRTCQFAESPYFADIDAEEKIGVLQ